MVLLIDEAENHLHYDAQADLVRVLENQQVAAQVIYSTHSAGCLPEDLGTAIRAIAPVLAADGSDTGLSVIKGSAWQDGPGLSTLMMAMGARAFSIAPARRALLTEGKADIVLLPSLLREATGRTVLGFQVVPGLASMAPADAHELQLEAPRVACLFDGDDQGLKKGKALIASGVLSEGVFWLEPGMTTEDYVSAERLRDAVNEELRRSHGEGVRFDGDLPATGRTKVIEAWCSSRGIGKLSRCKVAVHVVARREPGRGFVEALRLEQLKSLFERIAGHLKIPTNRAP